MALVVVVVTGLAVGLAEWHWSMASRSPQPDEAGQRMVRGVADALDALPTPSGAVAASAAAVDVCRDDSDSGSFATPSAARSWTFPATNDPANSSAAVLAVLKAQGWRSITRTSRDSYSLAFPLAALDLPTGVISTALATVSAEAAAVQVEVTLPAVACH